MTTTININCTNRAEKVRLVEVLLRDNCKATRLFRAVNVKQDGTLREYKAFLSTDADAFKGKNAMLIDMGIETKVGEYAPIRHFNMETALVLQFERVTYVFTDEATVKDVKALSAQTALRTAAQLSSSVLPLINANLA